MFQFQRYVCGHAPCQFELVAQPSRLLAVYQVVVVVATIGILVCVEITVRVQSGNPSRLHLTCHGLCSVYMLLLAFLQSYGLLILQG